MSLNRLQKQLARQIVDRLNEQRPATGSKVSTAALSRHFGVSRSPVRTALTWLADAGALQAVSGRGFVVAELPIDSAALGLCQADVDSWLYDQLISDLVHDRLPAETTETELMQRYQIERPRLLTVLQRLDQEGAAQRKPGRGWQFQSVLNSRQAFTESYAFRQLLEPQAPLQPGFHWCPESAATIREEQQRLLDQETAPAEAIFTANARFHEFIAACSGNRFLLEAVKRQNLLRRFVEYQYRWQEQPLALTKSCRDHLAILDALDQDRRQRASKLLWLHLDRTGHLQAEDTQIDTTRW